MVTVTVSAAGKPPAVARGLPFTVEIPGKSIDQVTIGDVKSSLAARFPKVRGCTALSALKKNADYRIYYQFYVSRQKLSLKGSKAALADDVTLKDTDGAELSVKDLGPQISWKVVFLIEYVSYFIFFVVVIWMLTDLYDAMEGWTYAHPPCDISPHPTFLRN